MPRSNNVYSINVHYPSDKSALVQLRKGMGKAYVKFIQDYIKTLPIDDNKKNELYFNVIEKLKIDKNANS